MAWLLGEHGAQNLEGQRAVSASGFSSGENMKIDTALQRSGSLGDATLGGIGAHGGSMGEPRGPQGLGLRGGPSALRPCYMLKDFVKNHYRGWHQSRSRSDQMVLE